MRSRIFLAVVFFMVSTSPSSRTCEFHRTRGRTLETFMTAPHTRIEAVCSVATTPIKTKSELQSKIRTCRIAESAHPLAMVTSSAWICRKVIRMRRGDPFTWRDSPVIRIRIVRPRRPWPSCRRDRQWWPQDGRRGRTRRNRDWRPNSPPVRIDELPRTSTGIPIHARPVHEAERVGLRVAAEAWNISCRRHADNMPGASCSASRFRAGTTGRGNADRAPPFR